MIPTRYHIVPRPPLVAVSSADVAPPGAPVKSAPATSSKPPAEPGEESFAAETSGAQPIDADFPEMFEAMMPKVVMVGISPAPSALLILQQAERNGHVGIEAQAYLAYTKRRFDALTLADCAGYGITAEQFTNWQRKYRGAPPA